MLRWIERALLIVGLICLGIPAWSWIDASLYQSEQGRRLDALLGGAPGGRHARAARGDRGGVGGRAPIGRLEVPRLGISAIIAEGDDARTLRRAVGHVPSTALPGEAGNVVLAGHRDSFFHPLQSVREGDRVTITTRDGVLAYEVVRTDIVGPQRTDLLDPTADDMLTLITCYPFDYVGPAPDRFVVRARPA